MRLSDFNFLYICNVPILDVNNNHYKLSLFLNCKSTYTLMNELVSVAHVRNTFYNVLLYVRVKCLHCPGIYGANHLIIYQS